MVKHVLFFGWHVTLVSARFSCHLVLPAQASGIPSSPDILIAGDVIGHKACSVHAKGEQGETEHAAVDHDGCVSCAQRSDDSFGQFVNVSLLDEEGETAQECD